jgi:hypothetical protein
MMSRLVGPLLLVAALAAPALDSPPPVRPPPALRGPEGELAFEVREGRSGDLIPCKITFVGVRGTPTPAFTRIDIGRSEGEGTISAFDRVMSAVGQGVLRVPYGSYDLYVSRGPEWDVAILRGVRVGPQRGAISARLEHVIDTTGWLSADFHVHAAPSPDSIVPMPHRVIEFVSDGVDMIVATDHNVVSDYQPSIKALELGRLIASATGDEMTTGRWGHFGAFPLPADLERPGQGAVLVRGRTAADFFHDVRVTAPAAVIDVHHPRIDDEIGYFNLGQFDPHRDRAGRAGFSFDFDALEVLNGYQDPVRTSVDRTIDDWMGLLNHGHLVTATGNSDTHHLTFNIGGYPRNYVRVREDHPDRVDPAQVARAVKDHHSFFTTGPFLRVSAGSGGIGDLVPAPGGHADVDIEVDAPPWMSVDRVIAYVNGRESRRWAVPPSTAVVRFRERFTVQLARDGYLVVRVDGNRLMAPVVGDNRRFPVRPLALANPVFLDVDGNGRYDPTLPHGEHAPGDRKRGPIGPPAKAGRSPGR